MIETQAQMMKSAEDSHMSPSPSFSSYSSETLAEIAARVIEELRRDSHSLSDDAHYASWETQDFLHHNDDRNELDDGVADDNDDFEFAFVCREPESSPVSADDIFYNGQIKPMYPLFDRNLFFAQYPDFTPRNDSVVSTSAAPTGKETAPSPVRRHRLPLRKLMFEERETSSLSSSTSEADDDGLNNLAPGTYCVWSAKSATKKSNSTGSTSKRWKLRDLLLRSHSEGKARPPLFLTSSKRTNKVANDVTNTKSDEKSTSADKNAIDHAKSRSRAVATAEDGDPTKKKSFLPYRQELVGLFNNVNGLGRNLHPF
ncbi:hypothetical protein L6164_014708 [Bauhinia variegata]|uniref:Uncharacterized protein n=1 Tax=Bauhinia variegata TaxID=167791 RepID=A0ACB9NIT0_BAUVA|nr:hypothetical protein L6164_014708 [Bauhinia variegata]